MSNGHPVVIKINAAKKVRKNKGNYAKNFVLQYCSCGGFPLWKFRSYGKKIADDCIYNGIKLYGKVKIVDNFADIKVRKAEHFEDLSVQYVKNFPKSYGKWQLVNNFSDITIKEVTNFPGIR